MCIWCMIVFFMSVVVTVWGSVGMFVVELLKVVFFSLGVLKYVVCLCKECDGCCVFCLYCEACSCRWSRMGSVIVMQMLLVAKCSSFLAMLIISCHI